MIKGDPMKDIILTTELPELKHSGRGKVRDIYDLGESLLIVTSDRISAFDVIMNEGIPGKGEVLTRISAHWFQLLENIVPSRALPDRTRIGDCRSFRSGTAAAQTRILNSQGTGSCS